MTAVAWLRQILPQIRTRQVLQVLRMSVCQGLSKFISKTEHFGLFWQQICQVMIRHFRMQPFDQCATEDLPRNETCNGTEGTISWAGILSTVFSFTCALEKEIITVDG